MHKQNFILGTAVLLLVSCWGNSASAGIEWKLRYPFRVFEKPTLYQDNAKAVFKEYNKIKDDWDYRKKLYVHEDCLNRSKPISCSEAKIGPSRRQMALNQLKEPKTIDHVQNHGEKKDSSSWLALAYLQAGSAYNDREMSYRNQTENYVLDLVQPMITGDYKPKEYEISQRKAYVWLKGDEYSGKKCDWLIDGNPVSNVDCQSKIKHGLKRGEESSVIKVTVQETGVTFELKGKDTFIEEFVVIGMGDSYASGEGAPDFAARTQIKDRDKVVRIAAPGAIHQDGRSANAAYWLERNCHRSFLSSQARAALFYAAKYPKKEIVFIHTACSGAEAQAGVWGTYSGVYERNSYKNSLEKKTGEGAWRTTLSQINQVILALCKEPEIDAYKAEFKRYFEKQKKFYFKNFRRLPEGNPRNLPKGDPDPFEGVIGCSSGFKKEIDAVLLTVGGNDTGFSKAIAWYLSNRAERWGLVKFDIELVRPSLGKTHSERIIPDIYSKLDDVFKNTLNVSGEKVIVSTYPVGLIERKGRVQKDDLGCSGKRGLKGFDFIQFSPSNVSQDKSRDLYNTYAKELNHQIGQSAKKNGWTLVDDHVDDFKGHAWCSRSATEPDYITPYGISARWIRTPFDALVTQNQLPVGEETERPKALNRLLKATGMFHPNGIGAAYWANYYFNSLDKVLSENQ